MKKTLLAVLATVIVLALVNVPENINAGTREDTVSYWKQYSNTYVYDKLSPKHQKIWRDLDEACMSVLLGEVDLVNGNTPDVTFYDTPMTEDEAMDLATAFYNANPQYYFINGLIPIYSEDHRNKVVLFSFDIYNQFKNTEARATATAQIKTRLDSLLSEINASDDKELAIHDALIRDFEYQENDYDQSIYSGLVNGVSVCAGYSRTFTALASAAGIENFLVCSNSHAWNMVNDNGIWCYVDTMWDDAGSTARYNWYNIDAVTMTSQDQNNSHVVTDYINTFLPENYVPVDYGTITTLVTPTEVHWAPISYAYWNPVDGADFYTVKIYRNGISTGWGDMIVTDNYTNLLTLEMMEDHTAEYTFKVQACSNDSNIITSRYSDVSAAWELDTDAVIDAIEEQYDDAADINYSYYSFVQSLGGDAALSLACMNDIDVISALEGLENAYTEYNGCHLNITNNSEDIDKIVGIKMNYNNTTLSISDTEFNVENAAVVKAYHITYSVATSEVPYIFINKPAGFENTEDIKVIIYANNGYMFRKAVVTDTHVIVPGSFFYPDINLVIYVPGNNEENNSGENRPNGTVNQQYVPENPQPAATGGVTSEPVQKEVAHTTISEPVVTAEETTVDTPVETATTGGGASTGSSDTTTQNSTPSTIAVNQKIDITDDFFSQSYSKYKVLGKKATIKNGKLNIKKAGDITVVAYEKVDNKWVEVERITITAERPKFESKKVKVTKGETVNANDNLNFDSAPTKWKSSNKKIATIDANGNIVAKKKGEVTITAVFGSGKDAAKYSYKLVVK